MTAPRRAAVRAGAALAAAAVVAGVAGCGLEQDIAARSIAPGSGQPAPALAGTLVDGGHFDLAAQAGTPVVVDFFASWCGPCHAQQPGLNDLAARYSGRVTFVGVDEQESAADTRGYLTSEAVAYPALLDPDGAITARWNVAAPPTTVVVDRSGRVLSTFVGAVTAAALEPVLRSSLGS